MTASTSAALPHVVLDNDGLASAPQLSASAALVAIVMPLHPPKLVWARRFLTSLESCSVGRAGWFPTFSSMADLKLAANASILASDALETALAIVARPARVNPITSKKWLGLRFVFSASSIPYALALDAEVVFVSPAPGPTLERWLHAAAAVPRLVFGTAEFAKAQWWPPQFSGRPILRATHESCALVTSTAAEAAWLNRSGVLDHYWWFHDAPLYERSAFHSFWSRLRWRPSPGGSLSWFAFDHLAYECHLLLS